VRYDKKYFGVEIKALDKDEKYWLGFNLLTDAAVLFGAFFYIPFIKFGFWIKKKPIAVLWGDKDYTIEKINKS